MASNSRACRTLAVARGPEGPSLKSRRFQEANGKPVARGPSGHAPAVTASAKANAAPSGDAGSPRGVRRNQRRRTQSRFRRLSYSECGPIQNQTHLSGLRYAKAL
jgi:hypothetical protein